MIFSKKSTKDSTFCSIVDSVNSEAECITKEPPTECDNVAIELFEPIKMETQHSLEDIDCLTSSNQPATPTTSTSIDQQPIEHEIEVEKPKDLAQEVKPSIGKPLSTASRIDLSNSLYAFGNAETICLESQSDIWSPVRSRICSRKNDLLPHANCFSETTLKEKRCTSQVNQNFKKKLIKTFIMCV